MRTPPSKVPKPEYVLSLYVGGASPSSQRAVLNSKKILDEHLRGRYTLEIVDIYENPSRAKEDQVFAAPTLIKKLPAPAKLIIGDLSDTARVLAGLGLA